MILTLFTSLPKKEELRYMEKGCCLQLIAIHPLLVHKYTSIIGSQVDITAAERLRSKEPTVLPLKLIRCVNVSHLIPV